MKKLILVISVISTSAFAGQWPANYVAQLESISKAEADRNYEAAYVQALTAIDSLKSSIHVNENIRQVESALTKVYDQKVIRSTQGGLSLWGLFVHLALREQSSKTEMVLRNSEESSQFPNKASDQLRELKQSVRQYILDNAEQIAHIKILNMKAFEYLAKTAGTKLSDLENLEQISRDFGFSATQTVSICTQKNYATYANKVGGSLGIFPLLHISASASENFYAHSTTGECSSSVNTVSSSVSELGIWNLTRIDNKMAEFKQKAFATMLLNSKAGDFPTFGNPYYENP